MQYLSDNLRNQFFIIVDILQTKTMNSSTQPQKLTASQQLLLDHMVAAGQKGLRLDEILKKINKEQPDQETLLDVVSDLGHLCVQGYIRPKIIETRSKRGFTREKRFFAEQQ